MSETGPDSISQLERLVRQIMKEDDPLQFDELGAKIWQVIIERERGRATPPMPTVESHIG